jgi:hypothetical protein
MIKRDADIKKMKVSLVSCSTLTPCEAGITGHHQWPKQEGHCNNKGNYFIMLAHAVRGRCWGYGSRD